jgi:hypothetical protein
LRETKAEPQREPPTKITKGRKQGAAQTVMPQTKSSTDTRSELRFRRIFEMAEDVCTRFEEKFPPASVTPNHGSLSPVPVRSAKANRARNSVQLQIGSRKDRWKLASDAAIAETDPDKFEPLCENALRLINARFVALSSIRPEKLAERERLEETLQELVRRQRRS